MDIPIDKHDILVGFFVLAGLVILIVLSLFLAGPDLLDLDSIKVKTKLDSTFGLTKGVPVTYLDATVGYVKSVLMGKDEENENKVQVEVIFTIKKKYQEFIMDDFLTTLEKQQFGGIVSGKIKLEPPEQRKAGALPIQDGKELIYSESTSLMDGLEDIPTQVTPILAELNTFLRSLNDPEGDFRVSMASLRTLSGTMADPEGDLKRTLSQTSELAARMLDRNNLLMRILQDSDLIAAVQETVQNMRSTSQKSAALAEEADATFKAAREASFSGRDLLADARPKVDLILDNILLLQQEVTVLAKDARFITATLMETTSTLPTIMRDVELQLNELEDISQAVKNIFFIRWTLEDESIENPVIQRPLLLHDFKKQSSEEEKKE